MTVTDEGSSNIERRLQDLVAYPREGLDTEVKGWLDLRLGEHRADLAKAVLALANHGGGYVLIGFRESAGTYVAEPRPAELRSLTQDDVNGIIQSYAEPAFQCEVRQVVHPTAGQRYPVVIVPGGHQVPIRAKRDGPGGRHVRISSYYIRRPGPQSECPQTGQEWDQLIRRCLLAAREDLVDSMRVILYGLKPLSPTLTQEDQAERGLSEWVHASELAREWVLENRLPEEDPNRFRYGSWRVAYAVLGDFQKPMLPALKDLLVSVQGHETGWPPWWVPTKEGIAPYVRDGAIECWLGDDPNAEAYHSDYWRASHEGLLYLVRGYQEDSAAPQIEPGTIIDLTLPIWRVGECLLHAERFATAIAGTDSSVMFQVTWDTLFGRRLTAWASRERHLFFDGRRSQENEVRSRVVLPVDQIGVNLPEIVASVTRPLYEVFDFFQPPMGMIRAELDLMRRHRH